MIVVAIIGILAAIAIPNFLRFQLKSKSSEGKVNIAAIRTAEASYLAEFGLYVSAPTAPVAFPGSSKIPFVEAAPAVQNSFNTLGWAPEGQVFFQYAVATNPALPGASYTATATADIDSDGVFQQWGYVKQIGNTGAGIGGVNAACVAGGVWDAAAATATAIDTVGPCDLTSGQSIF